MKLFECQHCQQPLYFESNTCDSCGRHLGYLSELGVMSALEPDGERWKALADEANRYRFCENTKHEVCNWMVLADSPEMLPEIAEKIEQLVNDGVIDHVPLTTTRG